ncbi:hypothetical protein L2E82_22003 [Cichorium intybus]|uniref:Uncharacterized protein n=1 Tax=Cichorium intybus TaxID=13427 RepID=A0ACB9DWD3_CICIN|nr:hypothetical protein L2E82_22003 [Cichorium intybus]
MTLINIYASEQERTLSNKKEETEKQIFDDCAGFQEPINLRGWWEVVVVDADRVYEDGEEEEVQEILESSICGVNFHHVTTISLLDDNGKL